MKDILLYLYDEFTSDRKNCQISQSLTVGVTIVSAYTSDPWLSRMVIDCFGAL